jgi:hypothetical protein
MRKYFYKKVFTVDYSIICNSFVGKTHVRLRARLAFVCGERLRARVEVICVRF